MKKLCVFLLVFIMLFSLPAIVCSAALVADGEKYYEFGDVNTDNTVNILELVSMKKILVRDDIEYKQKLTDIDSDGDIDSSDMVSLKKLLLFGEYFENDSNWTTEY